MSSKRRFRTPQLKSREQSGAGTATLAENSRGANGKPALAPRQSEIVGIELPMGSSMGAVAVACMALLAVFLWSYWLEIRAMVHDWSTIPDYSHGYLVLPVACAMLWARRSILPSFKLGAYWGGLVVIGLALSTWILGSAWFIDAVQAWSIILWISGVCWFLGGSRLLLWALPALGFLGFMIPLPYRAERMLSYPLQAAAARLSCWSLQLLGYPAIREGNVVVVNEIELAIVEACSGLRIFVSIVALAFAFAVFIHRPWWTKAVLFASVLPVALIANATRIALTGLLQIHFSSEAAHRFSHDAAGWFMIPFAAGLMLAVVWYMDRLLIEVETVSTRELIAKKAISS